MTVETVERLALVVPVAKHLGVDSGSLRPCIAGMLTEGVTQQREPTAHVITLELGVKLGLPPEVVREHLLEWVMRLNPPLQRSEIEKLIRGLSRPGNRPYACRHPLLQAFCIGEDCPHSVNAGRWTHATSPNGLTVGGWLAVLKPKESVLWLGCYRLARLKSRAPNQRVPFTFRELQRVCNVDRRFHRQFLENLLEYGLLQALTINSHRGGHSTFTLPLTLPRAPLNTITTDK